MSNEASVAAIQFALETDDGLDFLRLWNEGEFDAIRREWPEAPEAIYIGADPLHSQSQPVDLVPPGWTIKRDGAKLRIVAPEDGPGFVAWEPYHVHSFEQRMLYALAQALIGDKGPRA